MTVIDIKSAFFLVIFSILGELCLSQTNRSFKINIETPQQLKDFFHYTDDRIPLVSSHRGGPETGFPENCLATFENTISKTWSIMEIDPRYTKDSAIILMHDPTINRTSNGEGKISDYTLSELKRLKLKDTEGNLTEFGIPTLEEAIQWAKGKTILILDQKDLSALTRAKIIRELNAEARVMIMAYSFDEAKEIFDYDKNIMMEVFIPDQKSAKTFEEKNIPWENIVAFITHDKPVDPGIFDFLHSKGVMAICGSSRNIDKKYLENAITSEQLRNGYIEMIKTGTDVIEADLGIEAGRTLQNIHLTKSSKSNFFKY